MAVEDVTYVRSGSSYVALGPFGDGSDGWRSGAACLGHNRERFFPRGFTGEAAIQAEEAKALCRSCDVRAACLEYALSTNQEYGIWGGCREDERRVLRRAWRRAVATLAAP